MFMPSCTKLQPTSHHVFGKTPNILTLCDTFRFWNRNLIVTIVMILLEKIKNTLCWTLIVVTATLVNQAKPKRPTFE